MTNRHDDTVDPAAVGDTEDRLDHTGGGGAFGAATAADEDYVRRHTRFPDADDTEEPAAPSPEEAMRSDPGGSPVPGSTGAAASTGRSRGAPTPSR
jgi:hypothetical protein